MANLQTEAGEAEQRVIAAGSFEPQIDDDTPRFKGVRDVLQSHRAECMEHDVWHPYNEYFGPKEHYEEWRMMQLEKLRQQQATTMADIVKEQTAIAREHAKTASYHATIAEKLATISEAADQHTTASNTQAGRVNRWLLAITIATFFVGAVAVLLAAIQVYQIASEDHSNVVVVATATLSPTPSPTATRTPVPQPTATLKP